MGVIGLPELLLLVIIVAALSTAFAVARILRRMGHSPYWCLLYFVPVANLVAIWVLAYVRWPAMDRSEN